MQVRKRAQMQMQVRRRKKKSAKQWLRVKIANNQVWNNQVLVTPHCAIPRDYLSDTPYCAVWGFNMANWVRYTPPPFFWAFPLWRACEVEVRYPPGPPQKGYLSDTWSIPHENKANGCDTPLCDTISKRYCAIWGGISHWAAKTRSGNSQVCHNNRGGDSITPASSQC